MQKSALALAPGSGALTERRGFELPWKKRNKPFAVRCIIRRRAWIDGEDSSGAVPPPRLRFEYG